MSKQNLLLVAIYFVLIQETLCWKHQFKPFNGNTIVSFSPFSYARDAGRVDVADLLEEFIESQAMIAEGFESDGEEYGDEDSFDEGGGVGQQQHLADVHHLQHHLAHGGEEEEEEEGHGSQGLQQVSRGVFLSGDLCDKTHF